MVPGSILSNSVGPNMTLALAVIFPELTGKPLIVLSASSFFICVSLNASASISLASGGRVPGGWCAFLASLSSLRSLASCPKEESRFPASLSFIACSISVVLMKKISSG